MKTTPQLPRVRFVQGPEPGDREALVRGLAGLLIDLRRRGKKQPATADEPAEHSTEATA